MDFIIVTGLSGAGKSRAVDALEDIGFYCVDNIPPKLIPVFLYPVRAGEAGDEAGSYCHRYPRRRYVQQPL